MNSQDQSINCKSDLGKILIGKGAADKTEPDWLNILRNGLWEWLDGKFHLREFVDVKLAKLTEHGNWNAQFKHEKSTKLKLKGSSSSSRAQAQVQIWVDLELEVAPRTACTCPATTSSTSKGHLLNWD